MTIVTGTEYRANQSKYVQRVQEGERVIISSHGTYVELKPVSEGDEEVRETIKAFSLLNFGKRARKTFDNKEYTTLKTHEDIDSWFASL